jgi:hypothetical protein
VKSAIILSIVVTNQALKRVIKTKHCWRLKSLSHRSRIVVSTAWEGCGGRQGEKMVNGYMGRTKREYYYG